MKSNEAGEKPGEAELEAETAETIRSTDERLDSIDLFTLLDVDLNASAAELRRAYHRRSRLFHPDRYFSRELGPYKKMLERIFAHVAACYDFLKDDRRRAAYRRHLLAERDRPAGEAAGGRVVARETPRGLEFVILDEESFYAGSDEPAAVARPVGLPQKQYAMPRLRRKDGS